MVSTLAAPLARLLSKDAAQEAPAGRAGTRPRVTAGNPWEEPWESHGNYGKIEENPLNIGENRGT